MVMRAYPQELSKHEESFDNRVINYGIGNAISSTTNVDSDFVIQILKNQTTVVITSVIISLVLGIIIGYLLSKLEKEYK